MDYHLLVSIVFMISLFYVRFMQSMATLLSIENDEISPADLTDVNHLLSGTSPPTLISSFASIKTYSLIHRFRKP